MKEWKERRKSCQELKKVEEDAQRERETPNMQLVSSSFSSRRSSMDDFCRETEDRNINLRESCPSNCDTPKQ